MRIAHITPGTGGSFYCQNCFRDSEFLRSLMAIGHDSIKVPMYLPLSLDNPELHGDTPVFYGAINVYLKEKLSFYRHVPEWVERILDSNVLLHLAAKLSGSTSATGLEEMTLSMLQGEDGRQATELDHLVRYLKKEVKPDIVHLSNALLLGLARRLKEDLGCKVICSLQDENEWIDPMGPEYQERIWNLMAVKARDVDFFIASSECYKKKTMELMKISSNKIDVVRGGIHLEGYEKSSLPMDPPVIGYLCRMSEYFGLGIIVDAFIHLKKDTGFKDLRLHITGGYTGEDKQFLKKLLKKIRRHGYEKDVKIFKAFHKINRIEFLKSLTLLSVPVPSGESFGAYQLEALASSVPIVQPNVGCYPEFIKDTHGGVIYEPNDSSTLVKTIFALLNNPVHLRRLAEKGHEAVMDHYSIQEMAGNVVEIYQKVLKD
jgi:glycosyltransferase involved in cell wall biosynthesis